jgi:hypothetical protein
LLSTFHTPNLGRATLQKGLLKQANTPGSGFFDVSMLNSPQPNGTGEDDGSIVSLLRAENSRVRPEAEILDGSLCNIVDLYRPKVDHPVLSAWVDIEHGFAVRRHVHFDTAGRTIMDFNVTDLRQCGFDAWLPIEAVKQVYPREGTRSNHSITTRMKVVKDAAGKPRIAVNTSIPDDVFELQTHLPLGTRVAFAEGGIGFQVGGQDYESLVKSIHASVQNDGFTASAVTGEFLRPVSSGEKQLPGSEAPRRPMNSVASAATSRSAIALAILALATLLFWAWRKYGA